MSSHHCPEKVLPAKILFICRYWSSPRLAIDGFSIASSLVSFRKRCRACYFLLSSIAWTGHSVLAVGVAVEVRRGLRSFSFPGCLFPFYFSLPPRLCTPYSPRSTASALSPKSLHAAHARQSGEGCVFPLIEEKAQSNINPERGKKLFYTRPSPARIHGARGFP